MTELEQTWLRFWRMAHSDNQEDLKRLIDRRQAVILPSPDLVIFETIKGSRLGMRPFSLPSVPLKSRRIVTAKQIPFAFRRASKTACPNFTYCAS